MIHSNEKLQVRSHLKRERSLFLVPSDGKVLSFIAAGMFLQHGEEIWEDILAGVGMELTLEPTNVGELICYLTKDGIESVACMGQESTRVSFEELREYYERSYCDG